MHRRDDTQAPHRRVLLLLVTALLASLGIASALVTPTRAAAETAAVDLLPDLQMAQLENISTEKLKGKTLLRFGTLVVNTGHGPLEVHGSRAAGSVEMTTVHQRVFDDQGQFRDVPLADEKLVYSGDGHDHWHLVGFLDATLEPLGKTPVAQGSKIGYCLLDSKQFDSSLTASPSEKKYTGCGYQESETVEIGISVGWGDWYPYNMKGNSIDITGLPLGDYLLRVPADPHGAYLEVDETNNEVWAKVRLGRGGQVTVLEQGGFAVPAP